MPKIPQNFLRLLAIDKQLSEGELEVLYRITENQSIDAIAEELNTSPSAIYQRLAQIYSKFEIEGKGPGKLSRLQLLLTSEYENSNFVQENLTISQKDPISTLYQPKSLPNQPFIQMNIPSFPFSRNYQPSDWLKQSQTKIDSDQDINYILAEFPEHLSGAVDYLTYFSPPSHKKNIFKALLSHIEKFFIEQEKQKNQIPSAQDFQLSLGWNQNATSCSKTESLVYRNYPTGKEKIPTSGEIKLQGLSQS